MRENEVIHMTLRTRAYRRKMRAKHIKRKKRITSHYPHAHLSPYYPHDGMFSKGKIHCSCQMCKYKAFLGKHPLTPSEWISKLKLKEEMELL